MKTLSLIFSILLFFPAVSFLLRIMELYDKKGPLKAFGFTNQRITPLAIPNIIFLLIFISAFLLSVFFSIRKKYTANSILFAITIVLSTIANLLMNSLAFYRFLDSL